MTTPNSDEGRTAGERVIYCDTCEQIHGTSCPYLVKQRMLLAAPTSPVPTERSESSGEKRFLGIPVKLDSSLPPGTAKLVCGESEVLLVNVPAEAPKDSGEGSGENRAIAEKLVGPCRCPGNIRERGLHTTECKWKAITAALDALAREKDKRVEEIQDQLCKRERESYELVTRIRAEKDAEIERLKVHKHCTCIQDDVAESARRIAAELNAKITQLEADLAQAEKALEENGYAFQEVSNKNLLKIQKLEADKKALVDALEEDAAGRPVPELLRIAAENAWQLGGGPVQDCLTILADRIESALTRLTPERSDTKENL